MCVAGVGSTADDAMARTSDRLAPKSVRAFVARANCSVPGLPTRRRSKTAAGLLSDGTTGSSSGAGALIRAGAELIRLASAVSVAAEVVVRAHQPTIQTQGVCTEAGKSRRGDASASAVGSHPLS